MSNTPGSGRKGSWPQAVGTLKGNPQWLLVEELRARVHQLQGALAKVNQDNTELCLEVNTAKRSPVGRKKVDVQELRDSLAEAEGKLDSVSNDNLALVEELSRAQLQSLARLEEKDKQLQDKHVEAQQANEQLEDKERQLQALHDEALGKHEEAHRRKAEMEVTFVYHVLYIVSRTLSPPLSL